MELGAVKEVVELPTFKAAYELAAATKNAAPTRFIPHTMFGV